MPIRFWISSTHPIESGFVKGIFYEVMDDCLTTLEEVDLLQIHFSDVLWNTVVDHVTVCADKQLVFHFKNGADIPIQM